MSTTHPPDQTPRRRWLFAGATLAVTIVLAMAEGTQYYFQQENDGRSDSYGTVLRQILIPWLVLAALIPAIVRIVRIAPIERRRPWSVLLHIVCSLGFGLAHLTLLSLWHMLIEPPSGYPFSLRVLGLMREYAFQDMVVYWGIVGALHALRHHQRALERERESLALRESLGAARLQALRGQLHPHFLFNSLNTVAMLVRRGDGSLAVRMLAELSDLLRELLRDASATQVTLREEIDFTERYLAVEQIRFADRLHVTIDVDAEAQSARVPSLMLQPLVENAIRHGIAERLSDGRIEVVGRRRGAQLHVEVRDNGPGVVDGRKHGSSGIGLSNTRARLEQLYGSSFTLSLTRQAAGGSVSAISLPFSRANGVDR